MLQDFFKCGVPYKHSDEIILLLIMMYHSPHFGEDKGVVISSKYLYNSIYCVKK